MNRHRLFKRILRPQTVLLFFVALLLLLCVPLFCRKNLAFASTADELQNQVDGELDNIDFSDLDEISSGFFGSFAQKVKQIINGEFDSVESFWQVVVALFNQNLLDIFPRLGSIFCLLVLCGLARHTGDGMLSQDTENVLSFVGVSVVLVSVLALVAKGYSQVVATVNQIAALADASMPIMLTFLIANGGNAVGAVCQPAMVVFSSLIVGTVKTVILPLSVFGLAFVAVGNLSSNVHVEKTSALLNNASGWLLGILFTLFSAFTTVQGISASTLDGVSYRAAKFAAKNYIPVLGGYVSDGFDVIVAGTTLIKNSFGAVTMLTVFFLVLQPVVTLVCTNLGLQAVAAFAEPVVDGKYIKLLGGVCKCLTFLCALVVAVAFMFCILSFIAITCANY